MKKFNINNNFLVKLTNDGYDIWYNETNKYVQYHGISTSIEELRKKEDIDGYVKFQAWNFMEIFGPHISMGGLNLFVNNNILIHEKELENHEPSVKMTRKNKLERILDISSTIIFRKADEYVPINNYRKKN